MGRHRSSSSRSSSSSGSSRSSYESKTYFSLISGRKRRKRSKHKSERRDKRDKRKDRKRRDRSRSRDKDSRDKHKKDKKNSKQELFPFDRPASIEQNDQESLTKQKKPGVIQFQVFDTMKKHSSDDNTSISAINFSIKNPSKEPSIMINQSENEKTEKSSKNQSMSVSQRDETESMLAVQKHTKPFRYEKPEKKANFDKFARSEKTSNIGGVDKQMSKDLRDLKQDTNMNILMGKDKQHSQNLDSKTQKSVENGKESPKKEKVAKEPEFEIVEDEMDPEMQAMLGFTSFGSTKGKDHTATSVYAVFKNKTHHRKHRQYMNRSGGFNHTLDNV